jgi:fructose-1,6-bisphosphatase/sedoheptulose 1,7-bisphosphatase-like protein
VDVVGKKSERRRAPIRAETLQSAALNTLQWLGKGQKEKADEAAYDAIRGRSIW